MFVKSKEDAKHMVDLRETLVVLCSTK